MAPVTEWASKGAISKQHEQEGGIRISAKALEACLLQTHKDVVLVQDWIFGVNVGEEGCHEAETGGIFQVQTRRGVEAATARARGGELARLRSSMGNVVQALELRPSKHRLQRLGVSAAMSQLRQTSFHLRWPRLTEIVE